MKNISLRTGMAALLAAAALLLGPMVAAGSASAADGTVIGVGIQPLGVVEGPDGTLYVSDYDWAGGISVFAPAETRPSRTHQGGALPVVAGHDPGRDAVRCSI